MAERQRQSRFDGGEQVVVMKFGGTSVEDAAAIRRVIGIVQGRPGAQVAVVVSALARVTDQLLEAGRDAASGRLGSALATVRNIYVRHEKLADELVGESAYGSLDRELRGEFRALESLLIELDSSRCLDARAQDQLLGFGECFASRLVQESLREAGVQAVHVDARKCIVTDARHGQAAPVWAETNLRIQEIVGPVLASGRVAVLGGFIAATEDEVPTTLGRGGSDFSAAIVAAALFASRVEIWTDVDGVMTTDPKLCPDARVIRKMSFDEAAELASSGAKVLHPATIVPAMRENIPVYVLNSRKPEGEGTEITSRPRSGKAVSAIAAKRKVASIEVEAPSGINADFLSAVYAVLDRHSCVVDLMETSPSRISLLVSSSPELPTIAGDLQKIAPVHWENHKALVSLIGENIRRQPEIASRALGAVSDIDLRVLGQGASERSIAFLVEEAKVEESVQRLHGLFFPYSDGTRDWGAVSVAFCQAGQ